MDLLMLAGPFLLNVQNEILPKCLGFSSQGFLRILRLAKHFKSLESCFGWDALESRRWQEYLDL